MKSAAELDEDPAKWCGIRPHTPMTARVFGPAVGARPDEVALWAALIEGHTPRHAGRVLGIPDGRVVYLCEKWAARGFYDYGVSADLGWPDFYADDLDTACDRWESWRARREAVQAEADEDPAKWCGISAVHDAHEWERVLRDTEVVVIERCRGRWLGHPYRECDPIELEWSTPVWVCPWSLPVGRPGHEAVRAICVVPEPHGDDAGHVAVVDSVPVLFGTDVGERRC